MPDIIVTLDHALERIDVSPYKLAIETKIRPNTIYEIMANKKKMINIETMATIIFTLNKLAKENGFNITFDISDVFQYIED